jgi:hypothetical protein
MYTLLKILEKIYTKYKALIVPLYGLLALSFMWYVSSFVFSVERKQKIADIGFINKQVEKIKTNRKDFKIADIPYMNLICAENEGDCYIQRSCKVVNTYIDSLERSYKYGNIGEK